MHCQVIIVGAGVAGLSCARFLEEAGIDWHLFEKAEAPGGRVRTDEVDGFLLDRGFQVLLSAYPEARRLLDYGNLRLGSFPSGARVFSGNRWHTFADPLREPAAAMFSLPVPATLPDLWRLAKWKFGARRKDSAPLLGQPEQSTADFFRAKGFSRTVRHHFLEPFFRGILLDPALRVSSRMTELTFKYFSEGSACLPEGGMEAIPRQLANPLPLNRLHFASPIDRVAPGAVELAGGKRLEAAAVVVAVDGVEAARLLPGLPETGFQQTTTFYFELPALPPQGRWLHLCPDDPGLRPLNHIAFPSAVRPSYAPSGRHLASVNLLQNAEAEEVWQGLRRLFGDRVEDWRLLRRYDLPQALPFRESLEPPQLPCEVDRGLLLAGDHRGLPSLNSAMESGRRAAVTLLTGQEGTSD